MYKIDRRGGGPGGGVQKSFTRTDPRIVKELLFNVSENNIRTPPPPAQT